MQYTVEPHLHDPMGGLVLNRGTTVLGVFFSRAVICTAQCFYTVVMALKMLKGDVARMSPDISSSSPSLSSSCPIVAL